MSIVLSQVLQVLSSSYVLKYVVQIYHFIHRKLQHPIPKTKQQANKQRNRQSKEQNTNQNKEQQ